MFDFIGVGRCTVAYVNVAYLPDDVEGHAICGLSALKRSLKADSKESAGNDIASKDAESDL